MKTLFILRHAKSSWANPDSSDFDRQLNEQGLKTVPMMGETMFKRQFQPALVLSSPAKRAKQTAVLIKETAQIEGKIEYDERIYEASPLRLLQVISELGEETESLMLVGHNPGLEGLIKILTGEIQPMPTAALAVIDLSAKNWNEITAESGKLRTVIRPKDDLNLKSLSSVN
ncbi:MAG TPA: histidine phosphatase family protein [Pyrinomonadaceae bacterium]|jgi:phosphohistidine phosphatase